MQLDYVALKKIIDNAINEDLGKLSDGNYNEIQGDITGQITIPENAQALGLIKTRQDCVVCGIPVVEEVFARSIKNVQCVPEIIEGSKALQGTKILSLRGNAREILAYERVSLNLLQYMTGIATLTRKFVDEVKHTNVKILDTRKTHAGLRMLAKYAVWVGGGNNHRIGLYDAILIKDNHIQVAGSVENALSVAKLYAPQGMKIEIECDNFEQVQQATKIGCDVIMLDNMNIENLKKCIEFVRGNNPSIKLEASGGVNLQNVKAIAETGVDYISIGALTHSAPAIDIGLDFEVI